MNTRTEIVSMHKVWKNFLSRDRKAVPLPDVNFDEIVSSVFALGPFYYYVIDSYSGMSIENMSFGFYEAHGIPPEEIKDINDVLKLIHPDDLPFVAMAENKAFRFMYDYIGNEKLKLYKQSYNFRFMTADGTYQLYNHQSLALAVDEKYNIIKSMNIHTRISHLTKINNHKFSIIGLAGEPSYLNMDVYDNQIDTKENVLIEYKFTKREIDIIRLLTEGNSSQSIADKLFISLDTVKTHRKNIMKKTGCKKSAELTAKSISEGWV